LDPLDVEWNWELQKSIRIEAFMYCDLVEEEDTCLSEIDSRKSRRVQDRCLQFLALLEGGFKMKLSRCITSMSGAIFLIPGMSMKSV
jgi:hypothetical protein